MSYKKTVLPEPDFIDRDINKITSEMIKFYEEKTHKTLQPAHVERIIIDMMAYREHLVRCAIQRAAKQNLLEFASGNMLDHIGQLVGEAREPQKHAMTLLTFATEDEFSYDFPIPAGTKVSSKDGKVIFTTIDYTHIPANKKTTSIQAIAEKPGVDGNGYVPGQICKLLSTMPASISVENTRLTSGGSSTEEDDHYRERIKLRPESYSTAGTAGAYKYWVKTAHQDIVDIEITSPAPCEVLIHPLLKDMHLVTDEKWNNIVDTVKLVLEDEKIKPIGDKVMIKKPEQVDFSIKADIQLYNNGNPEIVIKEIGEKISSYIAELRSKLGADIILTHIISIINNIPGVYDVKLLSPQSNSVLEKNQWANCLNNMTSVEEICKDFRITGYVNG
nr:baseplate protein [bacterium]